MTYRTMPVPEVTDKDRAKVSTKPFCYLCGKRLTSKNRYSIHIVEGGGRMLHIMDEEHYDNPSADLGFWEIGPECAKKITPEYRNKIQPRKEEEHE